MKAILFDIDGTLINTGGAGGQALRDAITSEFGVDASADVPFQGRTDRGIVRDLFAAHGIENSEEAWRRVRKAYLAHLPARLPERQGRVLAGVVELLADLAKREHLALGLLTGNTREGARVKLEFFRIYHYFRFGGYGDLHYDRDDVAREAMGAAREHVGDALVAERVVVIGDTPLDVQCARAIGAAAVAVCTGGHSRDELEVTQPDLLLDDLADVARLSPLLER